MSGGTHYKRAPGFDSYLKLPGNPSGHHCVWGGVFSLSRRSNCSDALLFIHEGDFRRYTMAQPVFSGLSTRLMLTTETNVAATAAKLPEAVHQVRIRRVLCSLGITLGAVYAYSFRFRMSPDGIGYLDVASAYVRHDWTTAVNGWWSPAYSWVLAAFISVCSPTYRTEYPLVHLVNFLCFAFTSWSFYLFWQALLGSIDKPNLGMVGLPILTPLVIDLFAYSLFFFLFLPLIALPTPDVLASGLIFLIADRLLRFETCGSITWRNGVFLGLLFGLAYLAKGILFYFSIAALAMAVLNGRIKSRKPLFVSALVFAMVISPWIIVLHRSFGVWTLGFSGRLNYVWFVDGTETGTFLEPNGAPLPYFPGSRIFSEPTIYKVQTQPHITYVPWYDAARFYGSHRARFQLHGQMVAIEKNLVWLRTSLLVNLGPMSVAVIALLLGSGVVAVTTLRRYSTVAVPTLCVFAMYGLIFLRTTRYIAALAVVLFAIALASVRLAPTNRRLARAILASGLLVFAITSLPRVLEVITAVSNRSLDPMVETAEVLGRSGVGMNTHVAIVGPALFSYWARLARVNIAAEIWNDDVPRFWSADLVRRHDMFCVIANSGASVLVGSPPPNTHLDGWQPLGGSGYYMYRLSEQDCEPK